MVFTSSSVSASNSTPDWLMYIQTQTACTDHTITISLVRTRYRIAAVLGAASERASDNLAAVSRRTMAQPAICHHLVSSAATRFTNEFRFPGGSTGFEEVNFYVAWLVSLTTRVPWLDTARPLARGFSSRRRGSRLASRRRGASEVASEKARGRPTARSRDGRGRGKGGGCSRPAARRTWSLNPV